MTTFETFNDLPVEVKQNVRRIQALSSGERTTAEAAVLTALAAVLSNEILEKNAAGEIIRAQGITVPTGLSGFAKSATFMDTDVAAGTQALYENTGDTTTAAWNLIGGVNAGDIAADAVTTAKILDANVTAAKLATDAVTTVKIAAAAVTLAKLAAGITPSHIVKFAGTFTTAGGDANESIAVTGALGTDIAIVTLKTKGASPVTILTAVAATDAITIVMSADPSTDHVISYMILRAAA